MKSDENEFATVIDARESPCALIVAREDVVSASSSVMKLKSNGPMNLGDRHR